MANTISGNVSASFVTSLSGSIGSISPNVSIQQVLAQGTAINQVDQSYIKERSVATGVPDDVDLIGGGLTDALGSAFGPAKIVGMCIKNLSSTAGEILTIGGASSTFTTWLTGTNAGVKLGPGGLFLLLDPSLAAYGVTATSADTQRITAAAGTISYILGLMGRSA